MTDIHTMFAKPCNVRKNTNIPGKSFRGRLLMPLYLSASCDGNHFCCSVISLILCRNNRSVEVIRNKLLNFIGL